MSRATAIGSFDGDAIGKHMDETMTKECDEILDAFDAAKLCRLSTATIRRLAEAGEIPARRLGLQWRFSRAALVAWCAGESAPVATVSGQ